MELRATSGTRELFGVARRDDLVSIAVKDEHGAFVRADQRGESKGSLTASSGAKIDAQSYERS